MNEDLQDIIIAVMGLAGSYLAYRSATRAGAKRNETAREVIAHDEDLTTKVAYLQGILDAHGIDISPPE
jgi:hypothetical protein